MRRTESLTLTVHPGIALVGSYHPHGDKSLSHRAALLAALAEGESQIENFLTAGVTKALLGALSALEVAWKLDGERLRVHGAGFDGLQPPRAAIDCGNSATTMRLLAGALAASGTPATLDGSEGLRRRPMKRIVEPLRLMGVDIQAEDGHAPLRMATSPRPLKSLDYALPVASAQVKSCLLLAGLAGDGVTTLFEPGPSRDHTERMLRNLGCQVSSEQLETVTGRQYCTRLEPLRPLKLPPLRIKLPGDPSAAAFLLVAASITPGSDVTIRDVCLNPTRTGLLEALQAMGADITVLEKDMWGGEPVGDVHVRHSELHGCRVAGELVVRMIDEFPAFAVAAAYAHGETRVEGAEELRHKESDRIGALCMELQALGAQAYETVDGFIVVGRRSLEGGRVKAHGDHRLAMALAVAGLAAHKPVRVEGAEVVAESFPDFVQVLQTLGAQVSL